MAAIDLTVGKVQDVPEDAAYGSAHGVQDAERPVGRGGMIRTSARRESEQLSKYRAGLRALVVNKRCRHRARRSRRGAINPAATLMGV